MVRGLRRIWGDFEQRASLLLEVESDPRITIELLPDWERNWGLPDPCFPSATTIAERQRMLVLHMTWVGGQSRQYFIDLMAWLGYTVQIEEFAPFMAGVSQVGDTRPKPNSHYRWYIGPEEQRFVWTVNIGEIGLMWFRAASGQAGVDLHLKFRCRPRSNACWTDGSPHTPILITDFSNIAMGGPMQGTP